MTTKTLGSEIKLIALWDIILCSVLCCAHANFGKCDVIRYSALTEHMPSVHSMHDIYTRQK